MKFRVFLLAILIGSTIIFWQIKKHDRPISTFIMVEKTIPQVSQNPPCKNPLNLRFFIEHEDDVDLSDYDFTIRISGEVTYYGKYQQSIQLQSCRPNPQGIVSFDAKKVGDTKTYTWISIEEYATDFHNNQTIHVKLLATQNKDGDTYELEFSK